MKALWIVLGVVAALALLCCGGLFLVGRGAFNAIMDSNKQGLAYAEESLKAISAKWDSKELESRLDPEFKSSFPADRMTQIMTDGKARLGKMVKAPRLRMSDVDMNQKSTTGATTQIVLEGTGSFEKGEAQLMFKLIKRGDKWAIMNFTCTPK